MADQAFGGLRGALGVAGLHHAPPCVEDHAGERTFAERPPDLLPRPSRAGTETAQKVHALGADWGAARGLLFSYGLDIEPVEVADAERAAELWQAGSGLSLADRLCLATAERLQATVWTADHAWGSAGDVRQVR